MAKRHPFFASGRSRGFTLTELVVVIAIISIISVFAAARFTRGGFDTKSVYDQLLAQVTFARKLAIGQRRAVCVHLSAGESVLRYDEVSPGTCNAGSGPVPSPVGSSPYTVTAVAGVAFSAVPALPQAIRFDGLGSAASTILVTVSGDGSHSFTVERETGYVHP